MPGMGFDSIGLEDAPVLDGLDGFSPERSGYKANHNRRSRSCSLLKMNEARAALLSNSRQGLFGLGI
eukprot:6692774-Pyramimonas_sp.AAC.1